MVHSGSNKGYVTKKWLVRTSEQDYQDPLVLVLSDLVSSGKDCSLLLSESSDVALSEILMNTSPLILQR